MVKLRKVMKQVAEEAQAAPAPRDNKQVFLVDLKPRAFSKFKPSDEQPKRATKKETTSQLKQDIKERLGSAIETPVSKGPAYQVAKELKGTMVAQQKVGRDGQRGSIYPVLVPESKNKRIRSSSKDVIRSGTGSASYDARNGREILARDKNGPRALPKAVRSNEAESALESSKRIDPPAPRKREVVESTIEPVGKSVPTLRSVTKTGERLADRIYKRGVIKGNPYKVEPVSTVEVEFDDDEDEDVSDADTVMGLAPMPKAEPDYDYSANRDIKFPLTPIVDGIGVGNSAMKADPTEDFTASKKTKDSVKSLKGGSNNETDLSRLYDRRFPLKKESSNKTVSPEDTGEAIVLDGDPDEEAGVAEGSKSGLAAPEPVDNWTQPGVVDASFTEKVEARKGLMDRFLASEFWRYSVRGEIVEEVKKVGSDERLVERTVLVSKLLDIVGTVGGGRLLMSLPLAFYQRKLVSEEQRRIIEATSTDAWVETDKDVAMLNDDVVKERTQAITEKIASSKYLTADKKRLLELKVKQLVEARDFAQSELDRSRIGEEIADVVARTIKAREDITTVSRDAINTATMLSGLFALRAAGYVAATGYKAVRRWEGETQLGVSESKTNAAVKEFSTWWKKLRGGDKGRRARGVAEAVLTIAPTIGVLYQASDWIGLSEAETAKKVAETLPISVANSDALQESEVFESETHSAFTPGESVEEPIVREVVEGQPGQMPAESLPVWRQATNEALDSKLPAEALPEFETVPEIATVKAGDGVTWILMRQFKERAEELGYDATKDGDIHEWARLKARALAQAKGYLDEKGFETRIKTEAIGSISLVLDENGESFDILHKNGTPIVPASETSLYFEPVSDTPALLRSQGVEYVSGALEPDDAVRPLGASGATAPELSTTPAVPESLVDVGMDAEDDALLPEPEPEAEPITQSRETAGVGQVAELRVDSYGKMKVFETPDGRYTLDLSKFEVRRRHVEMMQELAISPESIDTPEERAFFQKLFAYAYTLDEMRKHGEEGGRVYTGLAKEVNRLFVSSYARMGIEVNPGSPLILPLLKPEYRIR